MPTGMCGMYFRKEKNDHVSLLYKYKRGITKVLVIHSQLQTRNRCERRRFQFHVCGIVSSSLLLMWFEMVLIIVKCTIFFLCTAKRLAYVLMTCVIFQTIAPNGDCRSTGTPSLHKSPKWVDLCEIVGVGGLSALYGVPNPRKKRELFASPFSSRTCLRLLLKVQCTRLALTNTGSAHRFDVFTTYLL